MQAFLFNPTYKSEVGGQ